MARLSHCLLLAVGAVLVLLQPATAQPDTRFRYASVRHYGYPPCHCRHTVAGITNEVWHSPFYGTFGAFEDTYWASHYPGPVQRRYYGYGWDPRLRF